MRVASLCGIGVLALCVAAAFGQTASRQLVRSYAPSDRAMDFPLAVLQAEFADMRTQGRNSTRMIEGGRYSLNARYLTAAEPTALVHKSISEFYFVREGSATLVTGGKIVDGKIQGGTARVVKAGDVVFIPPGVPHGVTATTGLSYLNVHFEGTDYGVWSPEPKTSSSKEVAMSLSRGTTMLAAPLFAFVALAGGTTRAQGDLPIVDHQYHTIRNWAKLPEGRTWGSTSAIDIDRDGKSVWVAERCGTATADPIGGVDKCTYSPLAPILKFAPSGKLVKSFGAQMFIYPHGMHVDRDGNIWVADAQGNKEGTKGHQVFKFSPDGTILLKLGKAGKTGPGPDTFNAPCDVVTAPNGDIFVADGHSASPSSTTRIMKFSKDGTFLKAWGRVGSGPGEFRTPHALAMDSRGRLFVADMGNFRIQIFDQEGTFLEEWKQFSRPNGIYIDKNDILYSVDSQSDEENHPGWKRGLRGGSAKDGKVAFFISPHKTDDPLGYIGEGVTVDADGNIYVAEVILQSVTKFVKR